MPRISLHLGFEVVCHFSYKVFTHPYLNVFIWGKKVKKLNFIKKSLLMYMGKMFVLVTLSLLY